MDEENKNSWTTFYNVRISIKLPPKAAYTALCNALDKAADQVDFETDSFAIDDGESKETDVLFPLDE